MLRHGMGLLALGLLVASGHAARAGDVAAERALAAKIDQLLAARWTATKMVPAPVADDAEYLRRIYLDLIGRIPSVAEARAFLTDPSPAKRTRLVEDLLKTPAYVEHFTNIWRNLLVPEAGTNGEVQAQVNGFNDWLRKQIAANVAYDRMVRELLTLPFAGDRVRSRAPVRTEPASEPTPQAFYLAKEVKPENLAASTAALFLGAKIECAQCHDHPTAPWTREQFWSFAAFFAGLQRAPAEGGGGIREIFDRRELAIPGSSRVVEAIFLDNTEPRWKFNIGSRTTLAEWMTAPGNRAFAHAAVNRLWAHFFGLGLHEPVDDFAADNGTGLPELLDELAQQFVKHQFDVQFLIRVLTASQVYQRTSAVGAAAPLPSGEGPLPHLFERMAIKGLTPEQLFDSLALATGYREAPAPRGQVPQNETRNSPRAEFLAKFAATGLPRTEMHMSIPQALMLMNGRFISDATSLTREGTLVTVLRDPTLDPTSRIETLFLATLSRKPTARERARVVRYVEQGGPSKDPERAVADVFWALLNSTEFIVNH